MSVALVVNGVTFDYPQVDDTDWGVDATDWASAVTVGMLQKAGGLFQLLAEVDFGTSYGLKSLYYKSRTANPADAGQVRLARADVVSWRNQANAGNLDLGVNSSDLLTFNGSPIQNSITVSDTATIDLTFVADALSADVKTDSITNSMINSAAAIAYSKLALTGSILNADISASAAIAYSKLALSDSILNADINSAAAIAYSKLALTGAIVNADISASAAIAYSKLALSNSIVNADISSSAAIAYSKLNLSGSILNADVNASAAIAYSKLALTGSLVNADVSASAAIAFSKLAALTSANILVGSVGNVATSVAVTGDITISNAGVTAIGANKVVNSMLAQMAQSTIKGRAAGAGTGDPVDLTATQATAILNNMVGDSGSGGTKGLVPAPAAGDTAAGKFLKADGTWVAPAGAGDVVGPASSTADGFAKFNGTTGKLLKNSAATLVNADIDAAAGIVDTKLATIATAGKVSNSATTATAAATNSAIVARNSWGNFSVNNFVNSVTTTATAAGTTTLDNTSTYYRVFTGSSTQSCVMPDATASISVGQSFCIINNSTGIVTVKYNDTTTLQLMAGGSQAMITCLTNATSNGTWKVDYSPSVSPTQQILTSTGTTSGQIFTITSGSATVGATYTNNGNTFTVLATIASATTVYMSGTGAPAASGTLTKSAGTGDASLTFSAAVALATYTTPAGCVAIRVTVVGGGAGGGGTAGGSNAGAAAGGSAGGMAIKLIASPAATYYYQVGPKGTGAGASNSAGNSGTLSTFNVLSPIIGSPGTGGNGSAAGNTTAKTSDPTAGGAASGGDFNFSGNPGTPGICYGAAAAIGGYGGASPMGGGGGIGGVNTATGGVGGGYGAGGGGGSVTSGAAARGGGDGVNGVIFVEEYYA